MLKVPETELRAMHDHALAGYPYEACGLMVGHPDRGEVVRFVPCTNVAASARVYTIDPKEHLRAELAAEADGLGRVLVVLTGGEPLLQLSNGARGVELVTAMRRRGWDVAVETNGTQPAPPGLDWICVSPKADAPLVLTSGDELKLVYPQELAPPERFAGLAFRHLLLQPMDGPDLPRHTQAAIAYCLAHPAWRLSVQTHKALGLR
ncbi:MAG: hypothetical protein EBS32_12490 [Actinobacteria bacterium]|nr:hypothetical protein [Actinomycetota bacterium]